jgi:ribonuclease G
MTSRELLIDGIGGEVRVAILEEGVVVDLVIEREQDENIVGNIYLGRVERVIPGIGAAFVDIGRHKSGFLPIVERSSAIDGGRGELTEGDQVCVQVRRDAFATKGPQLSRELSLAGRLLVFAPEGGRVSVSRQIEDETERTRLIAIGEKLAGDGEGLVIRTVAEGVDEAALTHEAEALRAVWQKIEELKDRSASPVNLYRDLAPLQRALRDHAQDDVTAIRFDDAATLAEGRAFCERFSPQLIDLLQLHDEAAPLFESFGVDDAIELALNSHVPLVSGGGLIVQMTEALSAIDVNSGRFTDGVTPDENARRTNVEAAAEIARQVRLRNLGGLIVVDFIHMDDESGWDGILETLAAGFARDRVNCRVVGRTEGGLVELIRRRRRPPLSETLLERCPECDGDGRVFNARTVLFEALRALRREAQVGPPGVLVFHARPAIIKAFEALRSDESLFARIGRKVIAEAAEDFAPDEYEVFVDAE